MKRLNKNEIKKIEAEWEGMKKEYTFSEKFSHSSYYQGLKLWEKYGKKRIYVPRNAYEQAGYIDLISGDVVASRPGNTESLLKFIEKILG